MPFVYHIKSPQLRGTTIYPLNQLRDRHPDLYDLHRAKYAGREALMQCRIPLLDKHWNDVVYLAPVHPYHIKTALLAAGAAPPDLVWFRIPIERFERLRAVYYTFNSCKNAPPSNVVELDPRDFEWFSASDYRELDAVAPETISDNRERIRLGMRPLILTRTLHVMVDGPIDITGLPVLSWDEPPISS